MERERRLVVTGGRRAVPWLCGRAFAHRGLHDPAKGLPENSLAALEAAVDSGYGIELDVRALASGEPVVFHDATLARMTGRTGRIDALARGDLADLRLSGTRERIPLLAQALDLVAGRVPLLVEVKNEGQPGALERAVRDLLADYAGPFAVISFNPFTLGWFRRKAPAAIRGQTSALFRGRGRGRWRKFAHRDFLLNVVSRPDFLLYEIDGLPRVSVGLLRGLGWPVVTYTVTTQAELAKARAFADNFVFEGLRP
jgi:glycerophosphoryl diester phosphodiesterase